MIGYGSPPSHLKNSKWCWCWCCRSMMTMITSYHHGVGDLIKWTGWSQSWPKPQVVLPQLLLCTAVAIKWFCFSFHPFGISGILRDTRSCFSLLIRQSTGEAASYVHPAGADVASADNVKCVLSRCRGGRNHIAETIAQDGHKLYYSTVLFGIFQLLGQLESLP